MLTVWENYTSSLIPLPQWVLDEIHTDPDLAFSDRFGRRNFEYISLGCDILPVLRGRSPIQAYADFMRDFRDTFRPYLGIIITGVQIGMGPGGELRYPSLSSQKLNLAWSRELGEFQCYDKYMLASLNASARNIGKREWGNGGPFGTGSLMQNPERTEFFRNEGGSWNAPYGKFFLEWYSDLLLRHGERICREAETIFRGSEVHISAKLAAIHWHYDTQSHPSELTAGYYNTFNRDGYLPILRMFSKYGFTMCCSCFEMQDVIMKKINPDSSPEGFLRQLLLAARLCDVSLEGQNFSTDLDDGAFTQVLEMSKFYSNGIERRPFSFNFVRMDKNMFEPRSWDRFTRFVRRMSDGNMLRARLNLRLKTAVAAEVGLLYQLYQYS
ncbi:beta-amylase chloroplastic-like [Trifolium pratense]|uniref:Beta-amylase n=1 Tax=Trifolium pratense TaxID=57577 RepID=A0A2K3LH63_TRIPR|nr:beta-amylase chloroplastic-like [Trifolium pratense]PNX77853.1 beta-amylase chloroplastic-like [Trifolium pratense]PNX98084.1 beta-amylase chloroplastic-like [Trifolium pratense]